MTVLNINNNVSEDYTYILDTQEIFYDKQSIPTDIYTYNNNVWNEVPANSFDTTYSNIKQFILTHSPPKLLNTNEDFLSLIPADFSIVSKKILLKDTTTDEPIKYYVVLATVGAVDSIVDVEMQDSTDLIQQVILNENFTEEDYFAMTIENCSREVFSDIPKGEYELFLKTENEEFLKYNQTIIIENNFPAKISIGSNTVTYTELQEESFVYVGISTDDQTNFPEIPKSQYFAIVFDENEIFCIPIKSLRFANTKITDIQDYTPNDNEYLSARQTYNMIVKALEEFEIFQVFDSQQTFSQIQNPKANCIYFVYKPSESSDGLNMNFDLYSYDPDNNSFIKLDNLTFSPNDFAPKSHAHGNLTNDGKVGSDSNYFVTTTTDGEITSKQKIGNITTSGAIGSTANLPVITTSSGILTTGSFGASANTFCQGNDSRLSNARTPTSHTHGNLQNNGQVGSTAQANKNVVTDNNGKITTENKPTIPSKTSQLTNDSGFLTSHQNIVTSWENTPSDEKVPSEKLTKDYFDLVISGELDGEEINEINFDAISQSIEWFGSSGDYGGYYLNAYSLITENTKKINVDIDELLYSDLIEDSTIGTVYLGHFYSGLFLEYRHDEIYINDSLISYDKKIENGNPPQTNTNLLVSFIFADFALIIEFYENNIKTYEVIYINISIDYGWAIGIVNNANFCNGITVYEEPMVSSYGFLYQNKEIMPILVDEWEDAFGDVEGAWKYWYIGDVFKDNLIGVFNVEFNSTDSFFGFDDIIFGSKNDGVYLMNPKNMSYICKISNDFTVDFILKFHRRSRSFDVEIKTPLAKLFLGALNDNKYLDIYSFNIEEFKYTKKVKLIDTVDTVHVPDLVP